MTESPPTEPPLRVRTSPHLISWLREANLSLAFTTYQANRLFLVGTKEGERLSVFERLFDRPMGLYASPERLIMGTRWQLWHLENALAAGETFNEFDRLYVPRVAHTTGAIDTHDIAVDADGNVVFVNTAYSCLATTSERFSFRPLWQPPFISMLAPEDRCHLNGLAMENGRPAYVTAVSRSDVVSGWRARRQAGGCLVDVAANEVVTDDLSMPHSPRIHDGRLWVLNSGTGELGEVDRGSGRFEAVAFCPGFLRGLAFADGHALVGLSKPRREEAFQGLALDDRLRDKDADARCGIYVIDLKRGVVAHWLELEGVVSEMYDVQVLAGVRRATSFGFKSDEIQRIITIDTDEGPVSHAHEQEPEPARPADQQIETDPEADLLYRSGNDLAKQGKLEEAIDRYVAALVLQPNHVKALINCGGMQVTLGRNDAALDCYRRAIASHPATRSRRRTWRLRL